jgi:hypothetical protein
MTSDSVSNPPNEPNQEGFAGDPPTPEPAADQPHLEDVDGERIAVPAGDLTEPVTEAIEGATDEDDDARG